MLDKLRYYEIRQETYKLEAANNHRQEEFKDAKPKIFPF